MMVPESPPHLSASAAQWWRTTVEAYELQEHDLRLLQLALEAWDRAQAARAELATLAHQCRRWGVHPITTTSLTFLQVQHGFAPHEVGLIAVVYNIGAIIGGVSFGSLSERFGRRRIIIIAASLSLPVLPLWAFAGSGVWLAVGAFLMQVMVQGAWGIIPVHLNELSPDEARGTFPGFTYQLGNLIASVNAPLQAALAAHWGGNYALALALVAGIVAVVIVVLTALGTEAKGVAFGKALATPP
jgi:SHS family lactate transporter-like MFS transporter